MTAKTAGPVEEHEHLTTRSFKTGGQGKKEPLYRVADPFGLRLAKIAASGHDRRRPRRITPRTAAANDNRAETANAVLTDAQLGPSVTQRSLQLVVRFRPSTTPKKPATMPTATNTRAFTNPTLAAESAQLGPPSRFVAQLGAVRRTTRLLRPNLLRENPVVVRPRPSGCATKLIAKFRWTGLPVFVFARACGEAVAYTLPARPDGTVGSAAHS
jgi:hypothetical protein